MGYQKVLTLVLYKCSTQVKFVLNSKAWWGTKFLYLISFNRNELWFNIWVANCNVITLFPLIPWLKRFHYFFHIFQLGWNGLYQYWSTVLFTYLKLWIKYWNLQYLTKSFEEPYVIFEMFYWGEVILTLL